MQECVWWKLIYCILEKQKIQIYLWCTYNERNGVVWRTTAQARMLTFTKLYCSLIHLRYNDTIYNVHIHPFIFTIVSQTSITGISINAPSESVSITLKYVHNSPPLPHHTIGVYTLSRKKTELLLFQCQKVFRYKNISSENIYRYSHGVR